MLQNAYFIAKIGADTAENEQHFAEILPTLPSTVWYGGPPGPPVRQVHLQQRRWKGQGRLQRARDADGRVSRRLDRGASFRKFQNGSAKNKQGIKVFSSTDSIKIREGFWQSEQTKFTGLVIGCIETKFKILQKKMRLKALAEIYTLHGWEVRESERGRDGTRNSLETTLQPPMVKEDKRSAATMLWPSKCFRPAAWGNVSAVPLSTLQLQMENDQKSGMYKS